MKWRMLLLATFLGAGTVAVPVARRVAMRHLPRFPYLCARMSNEDYLRLASRSRWASFEVPRPDGAVIRGLVRRPIAQAAPWVLFYPGNDQAQLVRGTSYLEELARAADWGLAVVAYRGFDASSGRAQVEAMTLDAEAILDRLSESETLVASRLHLVGFSIGGYFATKAASAAALKGLKVASLTLLASVDQSVLVHRTPWQLLDPGDLYQTRPLLAPVASPVLVVQGAADEAFGGPDGGRTLAAELGRRAQYVELAGVGHEALLDHEEALTKTRTFISLNAGENVQR